MLKEIPQKAIELYGIEEKLMLYSGTKYLHFTKNSITVGVELIKAVEIKGDWVDIRIRPNTSIMLHCEFNLLITTIL